MNVVLTILNKVLEHNEGSRNRLSYYHDRSFALNIVGVSIIGVIDADGFISNSDAIVDNYDVSITIPAIVASYFVHKDQLDAFRQITFKGDTKFGRDLLEILSNLQFDSFYATLSPLNGIIVRQLSRVFIAIKDYFILVNKNMATSISEYLLYETRDIVTGYAIEDFCTEVDELRTRADLLIKRINRPSKILEKL